MSSTFDHTCRIRKKRRENERRRRERETPTHTERERESRGLVMLKPTGKSSVRGRFDICDLGIRLGANNKPPEGEQTSFSQCPFVRF